jgi:hypothetical protein
VLRPSRKLTMSVMPSTAIDDLRNQLRDLDREFDRNMRARGFDPAQVENVALPSHLAALFAEREKMKMRLEELEGKTDD